MPITRLHHVNICTDDVAASARYYAEVFDLEARDASGGYPSDLVQWMYNAHDQPIIHLFKHPSEKGATGAIHHIAMDCEGRDMIAARLDRLGTPYQARQDEAGAILYMKDPHGITFELYFPGE